MLHARPLLRLSACLALGTCLSGQLACILPRDPATGLELRWQLPEQNLADAPSAAADARLRTCTGAAVARVTAELIDDRAPARRRSFDYACDVGDVSPADRVAEPAEIFIDLRPGSYSLDLRWHDTAAAELGRLTRSLTVEADSITPVDLELRSPLQPWILDLRGVAACTSLTLEIYYADPDADLHEPPEPASYRTGLVSDQGLRLAAPRDCGTLVDGPQRFRDLDRGAYRLRLDVDGRTCDLDFRVEEAAPPLAVDLAKPGCAG